ncbi:MAG: hypothetical protein JRI68_03470 [Deltaproteobacteria bacterium]|nr:hypothetical protein [Deltaproteobacteria bacterium]
MLHASIGWRRRHTLALTCALALIAITVPSLGTTGRAAAAGLDRLPKRPPISLPSPLHRPAPQVLPTTRQTLRHVGGEIHLYPPLPSSEPGGTRAPRVVMLHGMCSDALATCETWSRAGRAGSFLVCPTGNGRCHGWPDWRGEVEDKAAFLDSVLDTIERRYGSFLAKPGDDILIGFSRGAFVARDVAYARPGQYRGLILMGAALRPDAERLKASGIRAVVLASGDYDGARPMMQGAATALAAAGLPARFMSLGKIYHRLPDDLEPRMAEAISWIRAH